MTTNSVEGFHGLALVYRDKHTDLLHTHYVCKTNMAVCHKVPYTIRETYSLCPLTFQNLGPVWKFLCLIEMGVDIPVDAVKSILQDQEDWNKSRERRSSKVYHQKRCESVVCKCLPEIL